MDAAHATGHLQPQATLVSAETRQQQGANTVIAQPDLPAGVAHNALHPLTKGLIGLLAIAEMNLQGTHARQTNRSP